MPAIKQKKCTCGSDEIADVIKEKEKNEIKVISRICNICGKFVEKVKFNLIK